MNADVQDAREVREAVLIAALSAIAAALVNWAAEQVKTKIAEREKRTADVQA